MFELTVHPLTLLQVRALYAQRMVEDFPPDELKPLAMIERALARDEYACYGGFQGDEIVSYAFFVLVRRESALWTLLDYFAVRRDLRGQGAGSATLKALVDDALIQMDVALLEVDDPARATGEEAERRVRRLRFYLNNGLQETGVCATVYGVGYRILSLPGHPVPSREVTREVYDQLYRAMLPPALYDRFVEIEE